MTQPLERLRNAVLGRGPAREVEVAPDGTVREVRPNGGVESEGSPESQEAASKPTKLSPRVFGQ